MEQHSARDRSRIEIIEQLETSSFGAQLVCAFKHKWVWKQHTQHAWQEVVAWQIYHILKPLTCGGWYVPITTFARCGGSLQRWVSEAVTMREYSMANAGIIDERSAAECTAFDFIIQNGDRHQANYLIDLAGRIVLIDHGLAFGDNFHCEFQLHSRYGKHAVDYIDWRSKIPEIEKRLILLANCNSIGHLIDRIKRLAKTQVGDL